MSLRVLLTRRAPPCANHPPAAHRSRPDTSTLSAARTSRSGREDHQAAARDLRRRVPSRAIEPLRRWSGARRSPSGPQIGSRYRRIGPEIGCSPRDASRHTGVWMAAPGAEHPNAMPGEGSHRQCGARANGGAPACQPGVKIALALPRCLQDRTSSASTRASVPDAWASMAEERAMPQAAQTRRRPSCRANQTRTLHGQRHEFRLPDRVAHTSPAPEDLYAQLCTARNQRPHTVHRKRGPAGIVDEPSSAFTTAHQQQLGTSQFRQRAHRE